ncbi:3-hydroxyacyl-CoA dehydrogenase [Corynebacterium yudongzhengii]|uniref:3-hydroxyacyl-CoA dehydrogenase n=1 Tax=Corynebacterium yudongzhengii TaxID=2080740 RepID=A0A2U1T6H7_9CORY|nr:3-hydroxyacyl-CoA dehydrogenase NAD-binding domain-containing protein [Corynebacterium yudongzhengii]AWB81622.1 3-hydroxyacyl-CoA dehydrogenase [Corynebacterium yudongzhengii]PWC01607.1 3-hydroxyacyl-CoA dehydrogenase [Corynebacterium yudongzhengii]
MTAAHTVAVLGAGNLGAPIAYRLGFFGHRVTSYDISDDAVAAARTRMHKIAENYVRDLEDVDKHQADKVPDKIRMTTSLAEAAQGADFIIEAAPENLEVKRATYAQLAPQLEEKTVLLTNTSLLLPSDMMDATGRPEKFLAYHFANTIHLRNIVEIMPTRETDPEVTDAVVDFARTLGMKPIRLHREHAGYVINSLFSTWMRHARDLWVKGVADIETIDDVAEVIASGPDLRPFYAQDRIGFNVSYNVNKVRAAEGDAAAAEYCRRIKEDFMDKGHIGIESGEGFYIYDDERRPIRLSDAAHKHYEPID